MTSLQGTVTIARPVEAVFAVVSDPRQDQRWCPRVGECRQVRGEGPERGARYEMQHHPTLQRQHVRRIEIVDLDAPTSMVSVQEDDVARFEITYLLEPAGAGTRLTQRDRIDWRIGPLSRPIGRMIVNRHIGAQLRSLKRMLEAEATEAPRPAHVR